MPLVFLVLLVPAITSRPSAVAAIVGGGVALLAAEAGASHLSVLFGALAGIAAGAVAEVVHRAAAARWTTRRSPLTRAGAVSGVWVAIVLAGIGTYAMRASFLVFAHRLADVPPSVQRLLRQIPPAALAAIVIPALLRPGRLPRLLAAAPLRGHPRGGGGVAHPQHRRHPRSSASAS